MPELADLAASLGIHSDPIRKMAKRDRLQSTAVEPVRVALERLAARIKAGSGTRGSGTQPKANGQERDTKNLNNSGDAKRDTKTRRRGPSKPDKLAIEAYWLSIGTDMTQDPIAEEGPTAKHTTFEPMKFHPRRGFFDPRSCSRQIAPPPI